jgi:hypothetical protein
VDYGDMLTGTIDPMEAAQAAIRDYCGWHVAPQVRETMIRDGNGRHLLKLKTMRIVELHQVLVDGRDVTERVRWSEAGMLEGVRFPNRFRSVEIDLTHGFEPGEVGAIAGVLSRSAKRFGTDPTLRSQAVGGASVSYLTSAGGGGLSHLLTADEKADLDGYRLTWGV